MLHRKAEGEAQSANGVPPIVHDVLHSSGHALDAATRTFFESRFGADFSAVRVHTDSSAAESAHAVSALAYTVGRDIVFGAGQYAPATREGQRLLAHELTHVVQQGAVAFHQELNMSQPGDRYEQQAEAVTHDLARSGNPIPNITNEWAIRLQRQLDRSTNSTDQSDQVPTESDDVGPEEARAALVEKLGEEHAQLLERGVIPAPGEGEAELVADRVLASGTAPTIARMVNAPPIQRLAPIILAGVAAILACAFGFFLYAMKHFKNKNDKWLHCWTSCKIATYCGAVVAGGPVALLIGAGKEMLDCICDLLGGDCQAEWEDFVADAEGAACGYKVWQSCVSCCNEFRP